MKNPSPALFLDRDGVVNRNHGYVFEITKFDFYPEIFDICELAKSAGMPIIIITNQSGIGRGIFSESEYQALTQWMISEFKHQDIEILEVFHAFENPELLPELTTVRRKPSPQMFFEAAKKFDLNMADSIMIGDNESDMVAAHRAGVGHRILIGPSQFSTVASGVAADHQQCIEILRYLLQEFGSD